MNGVFGWFTSLQICTVTRRSGNFSVKRGLGNLLNGQKRTGKLCQKNWGFIKQFVSCVKISQCMGEDDVLEGTRYVNCNEF